MRMSLFLNVPSLNVLFPLVMKIEPKPCISSASTKFQFQSLSFVLFFFFSVSENVSLYRLRLEPGLVACACNLGTGEIVVDGVRV